MKKVLKSRLATCTLILITICVGVAVATTYVHDEDVQITGSLTVNGNISGDQDVDVTGDLDVDGTVYANDDIDVSGDIYMDGIMYSPEGGLIGLGIEVEGVLADEINCNEDLFVLGDTVGFHDLTIWGTTSLQSTSVTTISASSKLIIPVRSMSGDPYNPSEGQIYVNTADNKVRVYADGAWRDLATW